jgi:hypothetical protein
MDHNELFLLAVVCPLLAYIMLQLSVVLLPLSSIVFTKLSRRLVFKNTGLQLHSVFVSFM